MPCAHCKQWVNQWIADERWVAWPGDGQLARYIFFCDKPECSRARRLHLLHLPSLSANAQEYMYVRFGVVYDRNGYLLWRKRDRYWESLAEINGEGGFNLVLVPATVSAGTFQPALVDYDDYPIRTLSNTVEANELYYEFRILISVGRRSKLYHDICVLQRRYRSKRWTRHFRAVSKYFPYLEFLGHIKAFLHPHCPARPRSFG